MKVFHFAKNFTTFVLDEQQLGVSTLTLNMDLEVEVTDQAALDICMSRIYSVVDNIFGDGIICVDDNIGGEIMSSVVSNFCVQLPGGLNYEVMSELLYHKIQSATDNRATVTKIVIIPTEHNFGIEFNQLSKKHYVEGFENRWWFNPNLKFSDFEDEDLNAELAWEEINLAWPKDSPKKKKTPPTKPATESVTDAVVIEFPLTGK